MVRQLLQGRGSAQSGCSFELSATILREREGQQYLDPKRGSGQSAAASPFPGSYMRGRVSVSADVIWQVLEKSQRWILCTEEPSWVWVL